MFAETPIQNCLLRIESTSRCCAQRRRQQSNTLVRSRKARRTRVSDGAFVDERPIVRSRPELLLFSYKCCGFSLRLPDGGPTPHTDRRGGGPLRSLSAGGSVLRLLPPVTVPYRTPYRRRRSALEKQRYTHTIPPAESSSVTRAAPYILPWDGGWGRKP